jgi:hypothetical protein
MVQEKGTHHKVDAQESSAPWSHRIRMHGSSRIHGVKKYASIMAGLHFNVIRERSGDEGSALHPTEMRIDVLDESSN